MNKQQLISAMSENANMSKVYTEKALKAFIDTVTEELKNGGRVQLVGFGSFEVTERAERQGRNPATGETITIAASKSPRFKAGRSLKNIVNA